MEGLFNWIRLSFLFYDNLLLFIVFKIKKVVINLVKLVIGIILLVFFLYNGLLFLIE